MSIDSNDRSDSIRTRRANSQTHCLEHSRRVGASREDRSAPPAPARDTTVDLNESAPRVGPNDGYVSGVFDAGEVSTISTTYPYDFHDDFHFAFVGPVYREHDARHDASRFARTTRDWHATRRGGGGRGAAGGRPAAPPRERALTIPDPAGTRRVPPGPDQLHAASRGARPGRGARRGGRCAECARGHICNLRTYDTEPGNRQRAAQISVN